MFLIFQFLIHTKNSYRCLNWDVEFYYHPDRKQRPIHLSFDIDAFDPSLAPATGTPVNGGLTYREGIYIAEEIHNTGTDHYSYGFHFLWSFLDFLKVFDCLAFESNLSSSWCAGLLSVMDMVEVNPDLGASPEAVEATATLAVDVIASSLGQTREGAHTSMDEIPPGKNDTELRL